MVDSWKFISHVSVFTPFGTLILRECVPICTDEVDARYYPVWKVVQKLKRFYDCSLFTFDVQVSRLSHFSRNQFAETKSYILHYSDVLPKFKLYE